MDKMRYLMVLAAVLSTVASTAQTADSRKDCNDEIFVIAGLNHPMYKMAENDVTVGLHYGHTWHNGLGFRAGFQYVPNVADIDNVFGVPLALCFRAGRRSASERLESGFSAAYDYAGSSGYDDEHAITGAFSGFLLNLFERIEFYAGVMPGYVAGNSSSVSQSSWGDGFRYSETRWTEKPYSFSVSLFAGVNLNFRIWRFDLKIMPGFQYNITDNFRMHKTSSDRVAGTSVSSVQPLRWTFLLNGGLAFHF